VSSLSRKFLLRSLLEGKRPDGGRRLKERRDLKIHFGSDPGSCFATLGETKVLAQVSCAVSEPRPTRPNEGQLMIQVDFTPTCAPRFAEGTPQQGSDGAEEITEVSRLLERLLKESRCLDMESLCIVAEEKVWCVRLDIHVLNHEGNVADCAGVAGLAALAHFRRPDATVEDGNVVKIHPVHERDPIPLAIHHYPVCSTFAFFKTGEISPVTSSNTHGDIVTALDPNHLEESVMDGKLVLGINPYREICTLHLAGHMLINKDLVLSLASSASDHSKETVRMIKAALAKDEEARKAGTKEGLSSIARPESILSQEQEAKNIEMAAKLIKNNDDVTDMEEEEEDKKRVVVKDENVVEMVSESDDSSDEEGKDATEEVKARPVKNVSEEVDEDDESEEECTTTLSGKDNMSAKKPT